MNTVSNENRRPRACTNSCISRAAARCHELAEVDARLSEQQSSHLPNSTCTESVAENNPCTVHAIAIKAAEACPACPTAYRGSAAVVAVKSVSISLLIFFASRLVFPDCGDAPSRLYPRGPACAFLFLKKSRCL